MNPNFERIPFVREVLRGISQIMLQESWLTAVLFLSGLFIGGWHFGAAAILATTTGTLTARVLKFNKQMIHKGIYGYNPALVGITLTYLYEPTPMIWALVVSIGGILTVLVHQIFIMRGKRALTFPYILVTWALYVILEQVFGIKAYQVTEALPNLTDLKYGDYLAAIGGFGEVIFQENIMTSFLIFLGLYVSSPISALYGLIASLLGTLISQLVGQSEDMIFMGLFGFNAVLTAIAFSGVEKENGFWVLVGSILTIFINIFFVHYNLLKFVGGPFTFPFVVGTWITLWLKVRFSKFRVKIKHY